MPEDLFGLTDTPPEELLGLVESETETEPEQPEETTSQEPEDAAEETPEAETEAPAPEAEAEAQTEEEPEPQAEETDDGLVAYNEWLAAMPEGVLWAGKYGNPDDLEKGYNESREMFRRAAEARKVQEDRAYAAEMRQAELANILQEAIPYLKQAAAREEYFHRFAEQYRQENGEYPQGYSGPPQPAQPQTVAPQDVQRLVAQQLDAERNQMYAELQRQQEVAQTEGAVMGFYQDHPEVEPRGPLDNEITDTMQVLNESWASTTGETVDMSDRGTLEVLYEASQRPALRQVLALKPEYFDSETGLNLARREASLLEGGTDTQQTRQVPASKVGQRAGQRKPFAESAVTGAEAPGGEDENDPWVQIKREYAKGKEASPIFQFE